MSKHSDGPWTWDGDFPATILGPDLGGRRGREIICEGIPPSGEANARLIAAAPEMLAVLLQLRDDWFEPHYGQNDIGYAVLLRDAIRAAIAKAEGR